MPLPPAPMRRADILANDQFNQRAPHRTQRLTQDPRSTLTTIAGNSALAESWPDETAGTDATTATNDTTTQQLAHAKKASVQGSTLPSSSGFALPQADAAQMDKKGQLVPFQPVTGPFSFPLVLDRPQASKKAPQPKAKPSTATKKLFVLDTNVLLHDPQCLFMFNEHDVYLPMIVLEELDGHKKGLTDVARNARQISRTLDELISAQTSASKKRPGVETGIALAATGHRQAGGNLCFETEILDTSSPLPLSLPIGKADNKILGVVQALRSKHPQREVILVSNDINMRIKSRALGFVAEAYETDKALDDADLLYSGQMMLPANFWQTHGKGLESYKEGGNTFYRLSGPLVGAMHVNQLLQHQVPGEPTLLLRVQAVQGSKAVLSTMRDYSAPKNAVFGAIAKNAEQNFALNLLMDPGVDFVTLLGTAGTGKTLMTLAAGLAQVVIDKRYSEIIMTRATVSMGDDIGFLPGSEEEKMSPWMGALDDNLEVLSSMSRPNANSTGDWTRAHDRESIKEKVKVKSMNFMRGRTFLNRYVIIDEAQNLTPKQMKTLITRAGPGTKIVCMGNLAQIDTPYLTEGSSGLTFAVDRFKGWQHGGHITLAKGERSRLADHANTVL